MCTGIEIALAVGAAASTVASVYTGQQQASAQKAATQQAKQASDDTAARADQEVNRANAKTPDSNALQAANEQSAKSGQSGTMLTGPTGVDPSLLALGKNTLLGQ